MFSGLFLDMLFDKRHPSASLFQGVCIQYMAHVVPAS